MDQNLAFKIESSNKLDIDPEIVDLNSVEYLVELISKLDKDSKKIASKYTELVTNFQNQNTDSVDAVFQHMSCFETFCGNLDVSGQMAIDSTKKLINNCDAIRIQMQYAITLQNQMYDIDFFTFIIIEKN